MQPMKHTTSHICPSSHNHGCGREMKQGQHGFGQSIFVVSVLHWQVEWKMSPSLLPFPICPHSAPTLEGKLSKIKNK